MTTCNIGCGSDKWGDIRVDFTRKSKDFYLLGEASSANVIATVTHLPFVDRCFQESRCYQLLEHVPNWRQGLREVCRASKKVDITVPCVSHIARNEPMFIIMGVLDYILNKRSNHVPQVRSAVGKENLNYLKRLPERCKEHIWQFNVETLVKELHNMNFIHVNVQTTHQKILRTLKRKDSWRITAF